MEQKHFYKSFCARCITLLVLALLSVSNVWGEDVYYEKCSSTSDIVNGGNYIIVISNSDGTTKNAIQQNSTNYVGITFETDGTIKNPKEAIIWTAAISSENKIKFSCNGKGIYNNGSNTTLSATSENPTAWTLSSITGDLFKLDNGTRYIGWSGSKFAAYVTSNFKNQFESGATFGQYSGALYIYKEKVVATSVAKPTFSVTAGRYNATQSVTISCETEGASIYYTTDGTEPSAKSTSYTGSISVDKSMTINAIAIKGEDKSNVATATYKITIYESLAALVADGAPESGDGYAVTVTLTDEVIRDFYIYNGKKRGIKLQADDQDVIIFSTEVSTDWLAGGTVSANLTNCVWKQYSGIWELCPTNWDGFSYTAPVSYAINIPTFEHGKVEANATTAAAGVEVTLTVTPDEHYALSSLSVKDASANPVTVTDNKFTMPSSYVTVNAIFTPIPTHEAKFYVNGEQLGATQNVYEGGSIEFPSNPTNIGVKQFVGWAEKAIEGASDSAPKLVSSATMGKDAISFYAVFANVDELPISWNQVSSLDNITEGIYVIINGGYYLPNTTSTNASPAAKDAPETAEGKITGEVTSDMQWTFTSTGTMNQFYVKNSEMDYLYVSGNGNTNIRVGKTEDYWTFSAETAGFSMIDNEKSRYCAVAPGYSDWRSYNSSTATNYNGNGQKIELFKQDGGTVYSNYCTTVAVDATIASSGYSSFSSTMAVKIPEGVTAYYATGVKETKVSMVEFTGDVIPANTGAIIKGEKNKNYTFVGTAEAGDAIEGNCLVAVSEAISGLAPTVVIEGVTYQNYVFNQGQFHPFTSGATVNVGAGKAYLQVPQPEKSGAKLEMSFGEPTGIENVKNNIVEGAIYNLNGARVSNMLKGNIYIINGKKYLNK